jgi:dTDP-4-dehydrorhamnose reductase
MTANSAERYLVTGANGQLGSYLCPVLRQSGAEVFGTGHTKTDDVDELLDITVDYEVDAVFANVRPTVVLHLAAYTDVDGSERNPGHAHLVNEHGTRNVAEAARRVGAHLVSVSTDYVFDGNANGAYEEDAPPRPISAYGRSKLAGERAVLAANMEFAVARTAWLYGGSGKHFVRTILTVLRNQGSASVVTDEVGSPTFAGDLGPAIVELAQRRGSGVFHLVNAGIASRYEFAQAIAEMAGIPVSDVEPISTAEFLSKHPVPAPRPANSSLQNRRAARLGISLRPWREAVAEYVPTLVRELDRSAASSVRKGVRR